jgi:hypothetical protein
MNSMTVSLLAGSSNAFSIARVIATLWLLAANCVLAVDRALIASHAAVLSSGKESSVGLPN